MKKHSILFIILILIFQLSIKSQDSTKKVFVFKISQEIAKPTVRMTTKALETAESLGCKLIILELNTFGGQLDAAEEMRSIILSSKIPFWVFINNNAASAGALISLSCDSIYMSPGATIGAASVVNQNGEIMPDKYQSYMRGLMRATAQLKNRNPKIAEAMVDPRIIIENINDSGKVLTFTTQEAIKNQYCEAEVNSIEQILKNSYIEKYEIIYQQLTWLDKIIGFLTNPFVSGILIMLIIGGIYFEMQTPGIGFALLVAITSAVLYFAPLYLEGLAANWEILVFVIGVILVLLEIFVIPGFGVAGISGIVLIVFGLTLSLIHNIGFDFNYTGATNIAKAFFIVVCSTLFSFFISLWVGKKLLTTTRFGEIALNTTQQTDKGYTSIDLNFNQLIGKEGKTYTMLRPSGKIIVDNNIYEATAETSYIEKNIQILIIKFENHQFIVRQI